MKVSELKSVIRQITESYFTGATVAESKQSFTPRPDINLVSLSYGPVRRPLNPPTDIVDGRPVSFYPAIITVQIDLFTNGLTREAPVGMTPVVENTAEDDMLAFAAHLNSEHIIQLCQKKNISIIVPETVEDLTDIVNDSNYDFRAMMEITVYFTMQAIGYTGILDASSIKISDSESATETHIVPEIKPTPSGGGNTEMTKYEHSYFENAEVNEIQ